MNSELLKVSKEQADTLIGNWSRLHYPVTIVQEVGNTRLCQMYAVVQTDDIYEMISHSTERRYGMVQVFPTLGEPFTKERLAIKVGKVWYSLNLDGSR